MDLNMSRVESVETVVAQIQGLSSTAGDLSHLLSNLNNSLPLLYTESTRIPLVLAELDPSLHSLGYLYFLDACTYAPISKEQANDLVFPVARFIHECDAEQIHLAPNKFISVCKRFKELVMQLEAPIRGVAPLLTAVKKFRGSSEHLTTLHADFLQLCLLAKCYKTGSRVLEDDIFETDQPKDLFLYCYYGGMICIGLKNYPKALELLHNVITSPMSTTSAIAVEAYKKYVLISLIHLGQFSISFPKYTSAAAQRDLKNFCKLYTDLANCYSNGNVSELEIYIKSNKEKFESDHNLGLAKQVVSSMYKRNIQRLTQTYLTLSLEDIAKTVELSSPREAEMHVLQMIQDGDIYAAINQKDGMVRFMEDPEQYKTCEMIEKIDFSIQRMMKLSKKLTTDNELLSCDSQYLGKTGKERSDRPRFDFDNFDPVPQRFHMN